ncbi:NUDIX hydrolase [Kordiimonas aestuarii]|uniref:NUDIX hydrolase n=1 Tax=Kordiimonas aestuarii TaxID=1005925 RepID=UPI0021CDF369|nr:NUDIX hydrolase [Kordiimonas aestuarii]
MDARENPTRPVIGVGTVIMEGGNVLLIKRGKPPKAGGWSLPGGAQELGEAVLETARREALEETGLEIKVLDFLDVIDLMEEDGHNIKYHYTLIDYLATPTGGTLQAGSDASDACFFSLEEALALPLWSETRRILELAAQTMAAREGQKNE